MGIEAGIHLLQLPQTEKKQARAGEQHESQRRFYSDEGAPEALFFNGGGSASDDFVQTGPVAITKDLQGGTDARDQGSQQTHSGGECQDCGFRAHDEAFGDLLRHNPQQYTAEHWTGGNTDTGSGTGQQQGFNKRLFRDASGGCAQSNANAQFMTAGGSARQKESGNIRGSDQQDQGNDAKQQIERLSEWPSRIGPQGHGIYGPSGATRKGVLSFATQFFLHFYGENGIQLLDRYTGPKTQHGVIAFIKTIVRGVGAERQGKRCPDLFATRPIETSGHHADNAIGFLVQQDGASKGARLTSEVLLL